MTDAITAAKESTQLRRLIFDYEQGEQIYIKEVDDKTRIYYTRNAMVVIERDR